MVLTKSSQIDNIKYLISQTNEKCCVVFSNDLAFKYFNSEHRRLAFTQDRLYVATFVNYFHKPTLLIDIFNNAILECEEAGLLNFWISKYIDDKKVKSIPSPTTLIMESIESIFVIGAIVCLISFIVFIPEVVSVRVHFVKCVLDYITY